MIWIASPKKDDDNDTLEKRLWDAADQLRANSGLTAQQYAQPVLGLIFLRFAEARFDVPSSSREPWMLLGEWPAADIPYRPVWPKRTGEPMG